MERARAATTRGALHTPRDRLESHLASEWKQVGVARRGVRLSVVSFLGLGCVDAWVWSVCRVVCVLCGGLMVRVGCSLCR